MQKQSKIRFDLHLPLILIHTPYGLKFFDRIAQTSVGRFYAKFTTFLMPIITVLALFLIIGSIATLFSNDMARDAARSVGPQGNLLIPGLNNSIPILEGWVALVITIIVHEAGHGIVARVHGVKVDSTGIVLFLGLPIGAFVNIVKEELDKLSFKQKSSILTAGPMTNIIIAGLALFFLFLITSTLSVSKPLDPNIYGVVITGVNKDSLANSIGLKPGDIIQNVQTNIIKNPSELNGNLSANLGKTITLSLVNDKDEKFTKQATLPKERVPGKGILGVTISPVTDPKKVLDNYNRMYLSSPLALLAPPSILPGVVPFSNFNMDNYNSPIFGSYFYIPANFLFWIWFINFNVAIFNALPIGPLDGGQLYNSMIAKRVSNKKGFIKQLPNIVSYITILIVVLTLVLPWVMR